MQRLLQRLLTSDLATSTLTELMLVVSRDTGLGEQVGNPQILLPNVAS